MIGHFLVDEYGLARFDGTSLCEYPDPQLRLASGLEAPDFQLWSEEVRSVLIFNALFCLEFYHVLILESLANK